jgi:GNAT superfamily N-acetyltransferase
MSIEITRLHSMDRPRWADLWRAYLAFYETALPDAQFEETWARVLQDTALHGLAARRDGRIIGITHFLFHASAWTMTPVCYLQDLYVDEAVRGSGAGRALIEAVADRARAQASTRLYWLTQAGNATARLLYDRMTKEAGFIRYDYKLE